MTVTYTRKRTNHILHLLLSIITFGCWLPVWLLVTLWNTMRKDKAVTR